MKILPAILLLLVPVAVLAQSPGAAPVVRTMLRPAEGVVIGQPVSVDVTVLFQDEMQHPPLVRMPEAAGAQIMRFESQGTTTRDTIDGQNYVGQTFEFVLFPRRGGTIEVSPPTVTLLDRGGDPIGSASGAGARLEVTVPKGVDPSGPVLVADHVSVEQSWSPNPASTSLKAGDAIVRTIQRQADGVPALGMAEFRFTAPDGVRVYVDQPMVDDHPTRMGVDGHRIDKVTYVFEKSGAYELPALTQPWLTLANKDVREETLPGASVTVAAAEEGRWPTHGSMPWALFFTIGVAIGGAALAGWLALRRWRSARLRWHASAEFQRRNLIQVARGGDARSTYEALALWRSMLSSAQAGVPHAELRNRIDQLEQAVFGCEDDWDREDGLAMARAVSEWQIVERTRPDGVLPLLNPVADRDREQAAI